jgi:hypothetical protein
MLQHGESHPQNRNANGKKLQIKKDMKMAVFWVVAPCSLVEVYQRFRGSCCLHHQGAEENI